MKFRITLACVLVCLNVANAAEVTRAYTHATLIDGTGTASATGMTVLVKADRIRGVFADGARQLPKDAKIENLNGKFVIPGLIDAHVHLTESEPDIAHYRAHLRALLLGGVTAVRDMAGDDRLIAFLARQASLDKYASPDIFYVALLSGPTFFAEDPRAQGASAGEPLGFAPWMQAINGDTDIPLAIAQARGTGATGVKLYANLPAATVRALAAEAHRQGLKVWTHATIFPATPMDAVEAGADTISHSPYLIWQAAPHVPNDYRMRAHGDFEHIKPNDPKILALFDAMKTHGTILDATLSVFQEEATQHPDAVGKGITAWSYAVTRLAHERDIPIDTGTDSAGLTENAKGEDLKGPPALYHEIDLLVKHCGFTPLQAIQSATQISAMAIGQGADRGTVTRGKRADMVVLNADPSRDIRNLGKIDFVLKNGKRYRPEH